MWKVMHLCDAQMQDVDPKDILDSGLYRKCDVYKSGGGYDHFPSLYHKRHPDVDPDSVRNQFVVQLKGCPLNCPYCYVTREGVESGQCSEVSTDDLIKAFKESGCSVFHLMGGAPALYIEHWSRIIERLDGAVFHSDLLLVEKDYDFQTLRRLAQYENSLYAVSIKGADSIEFKKNTRAEYDTRRLHSNMEKVISSGLPFYITFTGMTEKSINRFKDDFISRYEDESLIADAFPIDIVQYKALSYTKQ